jgi:hypothetical protein
MTRRREGITLPSTGIAEWARIVAASLPPLTPTETAAIGRIAATLDARIVQQHSGEAA